MDQTPASTLSLSRILKAFLLATSLGLLLSQCMSVAPAPAPASETASRSSYSEGGKPASSPTNDVLAKRPGLGTQLGHEIDDRSTNTHFYRKSGSQPDAVATFHYNDQEGAKLMAEMMGKAVKRGGEFVLIPGKLEVSVNSGWGYGSAYEHYHAGGKVFVIGDAGSRYGLDLKNLTDRRLEVVVSIDGLDILDGQPASTRKRGYVVPAKSSVSIRGMKVGGKLRTLEFGTVAKSRAATAFGERGARNVGVIGMACYEEDESARRRDRVAETYLRDDARAFGN
ncbi:hypothetical protein [Brevifollis gellanilyticus]|nr:hypothetical protein [Brevifollis gellanilyticus]